MLLTNAKLEFKRLASWKNKQNIKSEDEEEYYENLIFSLKNIQDFFENSEEPFRNTNFLRRDAKRKIRYHMKKLFEYMKQYFFPRYTI